MFPCIHVGVSGGGFFEYRGECGADGVEPFGEDEVWVKIRWGFRVDEAHGDPGFRRGDGEPAGHSGFQGVCLVGLEGARVDRSGWGAKLLYMELTLSLK